MEHINTLRQLSSKPLLTLVDRINHHKDTDETIQFVSMINEDHILIKGRSLPIYRVYFNSPTSGMLLASVGWVLNENLEYCLSCNQPFTGFFKQISHCRACGNAICQQCCCQSILENYESLGNDITVCKQCYWGQELVSLQPNNTNGLPIIIHDLYSYGSYTNASISPRFYLTGQLNDQYSTTIKLNICTSNLIPGNLFFRGKDFIPLLGNESLSMSKASERIRVFNIVLHSQWLTSTKNLQSGHPMISYSLEKDKLAQIIAFLTRNLHITIFNNILEQLNTKSCYYDIELTLEQNESRIIKDKLLHMTIPSADSFVAYGHIYLSDATIMSTSFLPMNPLLLPQEIPPNNLNTISSASVSPRSNCSSPRTIVSTNQTINQAIIDLKLPSVDELVAKQRARQQQETKETDEKDVMKIQTHSLDEEKTSEEQDLSDIITTNHLDELLSHDNESRLSLSPRESVDILRPYHLKTLERQSSLKFPEPGVKPTPIRPSDPMTTQTKNRLDYYSMNLPTSTTLSVLQSMEESSLASAPQTPRHSDGLLHTTASFSVEDALALTVQEDQGTYSFVSDADKPPKIAYKINHNLLERESHSGSKDSNSRKFRRNSWIKNTLFASNGSKTSNSGGLQGIKKKNNKNEKNFDIFYHMGGIDGQNMLTADMLVVNKDISIDSNHAYQLKTDSFAKKELLLGWQIVLLGLDQKMKEIVVITGVKATYLSGTLFRLSTLEHEDIWCKLKRHEQGHGYPFIPLRKVF